MFSSLKCGGFTFFNKLLLKKIKNMMLVVSVLQSNKPQTTTLFREQLVLFNSFDDVYCKFCNHVI